MGILLPKLSSSTVICRYDKNPILTCKDIPYEASLVFNAGVIKHCGKYFMIFRNDYGATEESFDMSTRFRGISLGVAESDDGIHFVPRAKPLLDSAELDDPEILWYYDPRLTVIDGTVYMCFAADTRHGLRGCIGRLDDNLSHLEIISMTLPDNRNMVLFPEKIGGLYMRLERPFPVYSRHKDRFDIWSSLSPDLRFWGESKLVLAVEDVPYANDKIGPAAPPVKTDKGWLTLFHSVDIDPERGKNGWERSWRKRYCAGIMLLDLDDPSRVIGMYKEPLIAPEAHYETDEGYRQNVIFPGGMIVEPDGEVKIYYGASDAFVCLATAKLDSLISLCTEPRQATERRLK